MLLDSRFRSYYVLRSRTIHVVRPATKGQGQSFGEGIVITRNYSCIIRSTKICIMIGYFTVSNAFHICIKLHLDSELD